MPRKSMKGSHYNAVRRVLRLAQIYFESLDDSLMAAEGGYMTGNELANHCKAARKLMPPIRRSHSGSGE